MQEATGTQSVHLQVRRSAEQPEDDDDGNRREKKQPGKKGAVRNFFVQKRPLLGFHGSIRKNAGDEEEDGGRARDFIDESSLRCAESINRAEYEKTYAKQGG